MSDAQGDPKRDPETVTNTINGNEKVTHTSNRNFEQKILSNRTIPVVVPTMNTSIYQRIVPIVVAPHTLLTSTMKEVVADAASGGTEICGELAGLALMESTRDTFVMLLASNIIPP